MTTGNPGKLIFLFALPLMFGNVFQQLYTVVDTAIVGRGVGLDALAALGSVDWLNWMVLGIGQGFAQGFSVRMSQKYGEGDLPGLRRTIGISARLTIIIALLTVIISQTTLPLFLQILRVPAELRDMAELYIRILFAGIPAMMFFNYTSSVLRSVGDSKTPLIAMIISSVVNIILDSLTVFVLGWGIAGAASATIFAQCCAGAVCTVKILRTPILHFGLSDMKRDRKLSGVLLYLGLPVAFQNTIICIGGMVVQVVVNGFGMTFIAGYTATNKLYGIMEIAATSYGFAVTTFVGQNYGSWQIKRIRRGVTLAAVICIFTSVAVCAVMLLLGRHILLMFISSESAELQAVACDVAYRYLAVMSIFLPVLYLLYVYRSALQGMGSTVIPMLSGVAEFIIRVSLAVVAGICMAENFIFYAEVAAWTGAAILLAAAYYRLVYKLKEDTPSVAAEKE